MAESHREGLLEGDQHGLVTGALEFSDRVAGDVAVPLDQLVTLHVGATPADVEHLVAKRGFSRFPFVDAGGEVTGYLHLKDILYADEAQHEQPVPLKRVRRLATVQRRRRGRGRAGDHAAHRLPPRPGGRRRGDGGRGRVPRGRPRGARRRGHRRQPAPAGCPSAADGRAAGPRRAAYGRCGPRRAAYGSREGIAPGGVRRPAGRAEAATAATAFDRRVGRHTTSAAWNGRPAPAGRGRASAPRSPEGRNEAPPAGFEPALPPPEGGALSPELRGPARPGTSAEAIRGAPTRRIQRAGRQ